MLLKQNSKVLQYAYIKSVFCRKIVKPSVGNSWLRKEQKWCQPQSGLDFKLNMTTAYLRLSWHEERIPIYPFILRMWLDIAESKMAVPQPACSLWRSWAELFITPREPIHDPKLNSFYSVWKRLKSKARERAGGWGWLVCTGRSCLEDHAKKSKLLLVHMGQLQGWLPLDYGQ